MLVQIHANHFVAAIVVSDDDFKVFEAAPIIRYMMGWGIESVVQYCDKKQWGMDYVE